MHLVGFTILIYYDARSTIHYVYTGHITNKSGTKQSLLKTRRLKPEPPNDGTVRYYHCEQDLPNMAYSDQ
jgi:hypothetical protein